MKILAILLRFYFYMGMVWAVIGAGVGVYYGLTYGDQAQAMLMQAVNQINTAL